MRKQNKAGLARGWKQERMNIRPQSGCLYNPIFRSIAVLYAISYLCALLPSIAPRRNIFLSSPCIRWPRYTLTRRTHSLTHSLLHLSASFRIPCIYPGPWNFILIQSSRRAVRPVFTGGEVSSRHVNNVSARDRAGSARKTTSKPALPWVSQ